MDEIRDVPNTYCVACGMPQFQVIITACTQCGNTTFTNSLRLVNWELALTHMDKKLLRSLRISYE
jgi:ribosomal protein L37E